jgi:hypothetical protein
MVAYTRRLEVLRAIHYAIQIDGKAVVAIGEAVQRLLARGILRAVSLGSKLFGTVPIRLGLIANCLVHGTHLGTHVP